MAKQGGLGRGLGALLENNSTGGRTRPAGPPRPGEPELVGYMAGAIALLPISKIDTNPDQPRKDFDEKSLAELADSIRELGIIQPITVHKVRADRYQIISGERRFRASQLAGLDELPAYIREANDQTLLEMALVENIQRQNLHAMEVAFSLERLMHECHLTQEQLGDRIGKSRSHVANYIRLLNLPADMKSAVSQRQMSFGHARALVGIEDAAWQREVFRRVVEKKLSVRQTEDLASAHPHSGKSKPTVVMSLDQQKVNGDLRERFGTKAALKPQSNGSGRIEIRYESQEDLDRILQLMNL